jgi:Mn-dependent DtxR family transcriptional regulator
LLDSGTVSSRAELARHLNVSRARVTQVLRRLNGQHTEEQKADQQGLQPLAGTGDT